MNRFIKTILWIIGSGILLLLLIQLIPFGKNINNPEILSEPKWASESDRQIVQNTCFDCHSNETVIPWYAHVAPASWLLQSDLDSGRRALNFSDWENYSLSPDYITRIIESGEMPPARYTLLHPEARLDSEQKQLLINAIQNINE